MRAASLLLPLAEHHTLLILHNTLVFMSFERHRRGHKQGGGSGFFFSMRHPEFRLQTGTDSAGGFCAYKFRGTGSLGRYLSQWKKQFSS